MDRNLKLHIFFFAAIIVFVSVLGFSKLCLGGTKVISDSEENIKNKLSALPIVQENSILPISSLPEIKVARKIKMITTAYSSTVWQTDSTPFITAAGTTVRDGIVANNLFPFGTKIRFPEIYGDKIFVVEDRMHWKKGYYHIDIWFASYDEAKNFGAKRTYIEVLEN